MPVLYNREAQIEKGQSELNPYGWEGETFIFQFKGLCGKEFHFEMLIQWPL